MTQKQKILQDYENAVDRLLQEYTRTKRGRLTRTALEDYLGEEYTPGLTTNKKAEAQLARAQRLAGEAERELEAADLRTSEGKQAAQRAEDKLKKSLEFLEKGLSERVSAALDEANVALYEAIKSAIEARKKEIYASSHTLGNMAVIGKIEEFESDITLGKSDEKTMLRVYTAFNRAYRKNPRIFDEWIYVSEGLFLSETTSVLDEILDDVMGF